MYVKSLLFLMYIISLWAVFYAKIFSKSMQSKEQAESQKWCKPLLREKADKKRGVLEFYSGVLLAFWKIPQLQKGDFWGQWRC